MPRLAIAEVSAPVLGSAPIRRRNAPVQAERLAVERSVSQGRNETLTRAADITIALAALLFILPLLLVLAAMIKLSDGGPVIFGHTRVGRNGKTFKCFKLRSMVVDAEARLQHLLATDPEARREWLADQKLRCDPRITPFGQFLRKSSLDELPQLLNVLTGEMSI